LVDAVFLFCVLAICLFAPRRATTRAAVRS
jgi:hypothetical protein